jgi:histidinol-phosphate aminotransferase
MIDKLIRQHLRGFEPYHSARSEMDGAAAGRELIYLDANELALGSPVRLKGVDLNRYPDPFQKKLRAAIANRYSVGVDNVFVGVGSDEIIDLMIRLFCEPGKDSVLMLQPTYGVYGVSASLNNVERIDVQLDQNFQIDVGSTLKAVQENTKIIFCCSPNNPTGNVLKQESILELANSVKCMLVVDEAYAEFADSREIIQPQEIVKRENVIILKTLSKAWGSAGIRLGYCIAHRQVVSYLLRIKAPYNINAVTSSLALEIVASGDFKDSSVSIILDEKKKLVKALSSHKEVRRIYPSDANFILIEFTDARRFYDLLMRAGIVVRKRSEPRLKNCLRITIGTPAENASLVQTLTEAE